MAEPHDVAGHERLARMLTCYQATRVKSTAIAVALGSWLLAIAFSMLAIPAWRDVGMAGVAASAVVWGFSLVLAWPTFCPWCCERLFFNSGVANSPSWRQIRRQFFPHDIVAHGRFTCPHCRSRFTLSDK